MEKQNIEAAKPKKTKKKLLIILGAIIGLFALFMVRDDIQPFFLFLRKYIFLELVAIFVIGLNIFLFKRADKPTKRVFVILAGIAFFAAWYPAHEWYLFMENYNTFQNMPKQEIFELPTTQNERIQPRNNIETLAYEAVGETKEVSHPHLVKVGGNNQWTMAVQPAEEYFYQRMFDNTEEIFTVSSTAPFPTFSGKNRQNATFEIGESLVFSRNTYNACVKGFGLLQYLNFEPDDVYYMQNDSGKWVQVISLIDWEGFLFPYPKFGGVVVIESGEHDWITEIKRTFIGVGKYISPEDMKKYKYFQGQNINSERVSRNYAETFMFLGGFTDPMPHKRKTAVKIPDFPVDQNQLPFITDFNFEGIQDAKSGLYHYFGLEPLGDKRTALSVSVFIPADGTDKVYYYRHANKKEGLAGCSAMPTKVMEDKKNYDWTVNRPVEFRPFIHKIAGKKRMFWLTTVVSLREGTTQYDGAATPELAVIDALYNKVVWIDAAKPSTWERDIENELKEAWSENEHDFNILPENTLQTKN